MKSSQFPWFTMLWLLSKHSYAMYQHIKLGKDLANDFSDRLHLIKPAVLNICAEPYFL